MSTLNGAALLTRRPRVCGYAGQTAHFTLLLGQVDLANLIKAFAVGIYFIRIQVMRISFVAVVCKSIILFQFINTLKQIYL